MMSSQQKTSGQPFSAASPRNTPLLPQHQQFQESSASDSEKTSSTKNPKISSTGRPVSCSKQPDTALSSFVSLALPRQTPSSSSPTGPHLHHLPGSPLQIQQLQETSQMGNGSGGEFIQRNMRPQLNKNLTQSAPTPTSTSNVALKQQKPLHHMQQTKQLSPGNSAANPSLVYDRYAAEMRAQMDQMDREQQPSFTIGSQKPSQFPIGSEKELKRARLTNCELFDEIQGQTISQRVFSESQRSESEPSCSAKPTLSAQLSSDILENQQNFGGGVYDRMYGSKKRGSSGKNSDKARGQDMKPDMHPAVNVNDIEVQLSSVVKPSRTSMNVPLQSVQNPSLSKDLYWEDYKRYEGRPSLFPKSHIRKNLDSSLGGSRGMGGAGVGGAGSGGAGGTSALLGGSGATEDDSSVSTNKYAFQKIQRQSQQQRQQMQQQEALQLKNQLNQNSYLPQQSNIYPTPSTKKQIYVQNAELKEQPSSRHQLIQANPQRAFTEQTQEVKLAFPSKFFKINSQLVAAQGQAATNELSSAQNRRKKLAQRNSRQSQPEKRKIQIKEWFSNLRPEERVLAITTIDRDITQIIRQEFCQRQQQNLSVSRSLSGHKLQSLRFAVLQERDKVPAYNWEYSVTNRYSQQETTFVESKRVMKFQVGEAAKMPQARIDAQMELLDNMGLKETFEPLDTLTVTTQLVANADKFFTLCENCVGSNFLRIPLTVARKGMQFELTNPGWFNPVKFQTMAEWLLCFIERAIWLQYRASNESLEGSIFEKEEYEMQGHDRRGGGGVSAGIDSLTSSSKSARDNTVPLKLLTLKDQKNQPVFVGPEHHNILFKEQILPFWSDICKEITGEDNPAESSNQNSDDTLDTTIAKQTKDTSRLNALLKSFETRARAEILKEIAPADQHLQTTQSPKSLSNASRSLTEVNLLQSKDLNWLHGGLSSAVVNDSSPETSTSTMRMKLNEAIQHQRQTFRALEQSSLTQALKFVDNVGFTPLRDVATADKALEIRLEAILIESFRDEYNKFSIDQMGLSSTNKKLQKKKLRKKQKQQALKVQQEMLAREEELKMKEEEERQRKMIDEADQTRSVPKSELKKIQEKYMRMKNEQKELKQHKDDKVDRQIPAYPGTSIDTRGEASELTQKVHQNMVQL